MPLSDKQFMIRIPAAIDAELQAIARRENNKVSAVTRRLLSDALERERQRADDRARPRKRTHA